MSGARRVRPCTREFRVCFPRGPAITMSQLLTIAIPTYNRAAKLEKQLSWLSRNLVELEGECALIVSDNASTDDTAAVCHRWRDAFAARGVCMLINRNDHNLGPLANIA